MKKMVTSNSTGNTYNGVPPTDRRPKPNGGKQAKKG